MDLEKIVFRFLFKAVVLKDCKKHRKWIASFTIHRKEGFGLAHYLKESALFDNMSNENKTYLVIDRWRGEIVGYFSLKCSIISFTFPEHLKKYDKGVMKKYSEVLPSIEIAQLAVNEEYRQKLNQLYHMNIKLGSMIFKHMILVKIKRMQAFIGVKMITLFALPYDKLIKNYEAWGFQKADDTKQFIKPTYDWHCVFMFREIDNT